jgi:MFS family permease
MSVEADLDSPPGRLSPADLATLFFAQFAMSVSMSFVFAVLPPMGRDLGLSELQLGLIVSPAALVFVFASGVWGALSERLGRKPMIVVAVTAAMLATLAFGWIIEARLSGFISVTTLFLLLAVCRIVLGALAGGLLPAVQAYVAETTTPDSRTSALAVTGAGFALGLVMGPGIAAAASSLGVTAPFYIIGGLACVATVVVLFTLTEHKHESSPTKGRKPATRFTRLWALLAILLLAFTSYSILLQITGFRMQDQFALPGPEAARRAGIALMVAAAGLVATQIAVARLRLSVKRSGQALLVGAGFMVFGMGVLGLVSDYGQQLGAMTLFGVGMGMVLPSTLSLLTVIAQDSGDQGRVGGWSGAAQGLGLVFGPLAGSIVYRLEHAAPYSVGFVLLVIAALLAACGVPKALRGGVQIE